MLDGPCWFLIALFYCKIFTDFALKKKKIALFVWGILFFLLCIYVHKYLLVANAMMAMPFYAFGYVFKNKLRSIANMKTPVNLILTTVLLLVVLFIMHINGSISMWAIRFGYLGKLSIPVFYIQGVAGTLMLLSLCAMIKRPNPMVTRWADSLISILGFQMLFVFLSDNFLRVEWSYFEALVISVVILFLCIGCHDIIVRYCPVLIGKSKKIIV